MKKNFLRRFHPGHKRRVTPAQPGVAAASTTPAGFAGQSLAFTPDPLQTEVLDSPAKRGILLCTRQWGKSTVIAAKAVHRAFTTPGALILVASPAGRQSRVFLRKAAAFLGRLGVPRRGDGDNPGSLLFPNGSRIVPLPGSEATIRGFSAVSMVLIDEASRVTDAMYLALQPMLSVSNGDLWLMSTPWGKQGFFYDVWTHGEDWTRFTAAAPDCPRISPAWLERQRSEMPGPWFRQEYLCEFVDSDDSWFPRDLVESALTESEKPLEV